MAHEGGEDVGRRDARRGGATEEFAGLVVLLGRGEWGDSGDCGRFGTRRNVLIRDTSDRPRSKGPIGEPESSVQSDQIDGYRTRQAEPCGDTCSGWWRFSRPCSCGGSDRARASWPVPQPPADYGEGAPPRGLSALSTSASWPTVSRIATSDPVVFVTIDDGWTRSPAAYDAIRQRGWPVTSFVLPEPLRADPNYFTTIGSPSSFGTHSVDTET